jgi:hypothetical protein
LLQQFLIGALWKDLLPAIPTGTVAGLGRALFSRSWARFEKAAADPAAHQLQGLLAILQRNAGTVFGREHGFERIRTAADYRSAVPVRSWDGFEPYIARMFDGEKNVLTSEDVLFFARSSGTTGTPKHVPVTQEFLEEYKTGRRVWMRQVISSFPGLVRGTLLTIHSPKIEYRSPAGVPCGSITIPLGLNSMGLSVAGGFQDIPMEVFYIPEFEAKYYCILRFALETDISIIGAINPSTVVLFCRKLTEFAPRLIEDLNAGTISNAPLMDPVMRARLGRRLSPNPEMARKVAGSLEKNGRVMPRDLWPSLCGLLSWKGGSAPFYTAQFPGWFGDLPVMDYGFGATEGNFTTPLSPEGDDGVLIPNGHFMEFIPEGEISRGGDAAVGMESLEKGGRYFTIVTASNGLYRYDINDIVECTGRHLNTPTVRFLHKGGNMISITGEKVGEAHVVEAAAAACARTGVELNGFTCTARLAETPYYVFGVEPAGEADRAALHGLLSAFDEALAGANFEYAEKRKSLRLGPPVLAVLKRGAFAAYRERRVAEGAPDSHVKPPHLSGDDGLIRSLGVEEGR